MRTSSPKAPGAAHTGKAAATAGRRSLSPMAHRQRPRTKASAPPPTGEVPDANASSPSAAVAETNSQRITVAVRIKPTDGAKTLMRFGLRQEGSLRFCHLDGGKADDSKHFAYDALFDQGDSQENLYEQLGGPVLQQVLSGYNASVFAYGQTGSGKTYTMLGSGGAERGLIPRLCEGLFGREELQGWTVSASFFEIYNEQVVDLLAESKDDAPAEPDARQAWAGAGLAPTRKVPALDAARRARVHVCTGTRAPLTCMARALRAHTHAGAGAQRAARARARQTRCVRRGPH